MVPSPVSGARLADGVAALGRGRIPAPRLVVERFELECGAVLLVDHRPEAPVTAIKVHLRGGHSLDRPGMEGTAFLTGRLLDQGTASRTEEELALMLETEGGSLRGDALGISGSIAGSAWKLLVDVVCDVMAHPAFPEPKVLRHKQRLIDQLTVEAEDHRLQGGLLFRRLVYGEHWLGRPSYGTLATVGVIEREHLVAFHRENWCPRRTVIAVCGDIEPGKLKRAFDKHLRGWESGAPLPPPDMSFPSPTARSGAFFADRQQVHVFLGHLGVTRKHALYPALVVMDHVLGTGPGFTNRISRRLRDEEGLAYSVQADIHSSAGLFPGMFTAYIGTSPGHLERAARGFLEEMRRIGTELVSEEELELAKNYLLGSFALGFERASRRANYMIGFERYGLAADHLERLPMEFAAVTAEDVRLAARTCLFPDAPCLAIAGPVKAERAQELLSRLLRVPRTRRRARK